MSKRRQQSGEDYPEAALKHCDDARRLLNAGRPDGAGYLAGYAVECVLKTVIQVEQNHAQPVLTLGHNLNNLSSQAMQLAALPNSRTSRYFKSPSAATTLVYATPPAGWKETLRYYPAGTLSNATAQSWVDEADTLYLEVIGELRKDGEI